MHEGIRLLQERVKAAEDQNVALMAEVQQFRELVNDHDEKLVGLQPKKGRPKCKSESQSNGSRLELCNCLEVDE